MLMLWFWEDLQLITFNTQQHKLIPIKQVFKVKSIFHGLHLVSVAKQLEIADETLRKDNFRFFPYNQKRFREMMSKDYLVTF